MLVALFGCPIPRSIYQIKFNGVTCEPMSSIDIGERTNKPPDEDSESVGGLLLGMKVKPTFGCT
jgi:hypothetical protein